VQTSTLALPRLRRHFGRQHAVETDHRLQVGALARQLQHHRPAKTEPDRRQPAGIDLRQRGERTQRGMATGAEFFRLGAKPADQRCDFLQIGRLPPIAEHVGGQRDIAETGEPARALHREFAEPEPFVKHQHAGPRPDSILVNGKIAAQIGLVTAVVDVARLNQKQIPDPSNNKEPELHTGLQAAQPKSQSCALP
jgi:hypothetical protein